MPPSTGHSILRLVWDVARFRGDLARMVDVTTRKQARRPTAELVTDLRDNAAVELRAPVVGPYGPLTDTAIHLRDAARPLGLDVSPAPVDWLPVLGFLVARSAERGFVGTGRTAGLRLVSTDSAWSWGTGELVRGTSEALAMGIAGRCVVYPELEGDGVSLLRGRDR